MQTESDCTIYLIDGKTFTRKTVEGVHWEDQRGLNFNRTGSKDVDAVSVFIPLAKVDLPCLSGGSKRNYIVRGIVEYDITSENAEIAFLKGHDVLTITRIDKNDYGSPALQHWEVGAK